MVIGFQLSIGRENAGEDRPSFLHWFGMQSSRAGASWLQEALSGQLAEALPSRNAREFRLPGGKSIVVDDATGIMRAMNVVEPDGRRWNLTLRDLSTEGTFPAVTPPEDLPVAAFRDEAVGWLVANRIGGIKRVFEWVDANWDDLSKGGRLPAVQALVRKYLAFLVEQFEESYVRKAASWQARRWLQSGLTPEELRSDMESLSAGFAKGLGEQKEELRKGSSIFIEGSLENIRAGIRPSRETPREEVLSFMNEVFRPVDVLTLVTDVDPKRVRIILGEEVSRPTGR
jgi:hypothetical protein